MNKSDCPECKNLNEGLVMKGHGHRPNNTSPEKEVEISNLGKDLGEYAKDHPVKEANYLDSVVDSFRAKFPVENGLFSTKSGLRMQADPKEIEQFLREKLEERGKKIDEWFQAGEKYGRRERTQEIIEIAERYKRNATNVMGGLDKSQFDRLLEELKG